MDRMDDTPKHRGLERDPEVRILRKLAEAGEDGLSEAQLGIRTQIAPPRLAGHLDFLAAAGLVVRSPSGRTITTCQQKSDFQLFSAVMYHKTFSDAPQRAANVG